MQFGNFKLKKEDILRSIKSQWREIVAYSKREPKKTIIFLLVVLFIVSLLTLGFIANQQRKIYRARAAHSGCGTCSGEYSDWWEMCSVPIQADIRCSRFQPGHSGCGTCNGEYSDWWEACLDVVQPDSRCDQFTQSSSSSSSSSSSGPTCAINAQQSELLGLPPCSSSSSSRSSSSSSSSSSCGAGYEWCINVQGCMPTDVNCGCGFLEVSCPGGGCALFGFCGTSSSSSSSSSSVAACTQDSDCGFLRKCCLAGTTNAGSCIGVLYDCNTAYSSSSSSSESSSSSGGGGGESSSSSSSSSEGQPSSSSSSSEAPAQTLQPPDSVAAACRRSEGPVELAWTDPNTNPTADYYMITRAESDGLYNTFFNNITTRSYRDAAVSYATGAVSYKISACKTQVGVGCSNPAVATASCPAPNQPPIVSKTETKTVAASYDRNGIWLTTAKFFNDTITVNLKLKFQGIGIEDPQTREVEVEPLAGSRTLNVKVTLVGRPGAYYLLIKGPKHSQKKICTSTPTETRQGEYRCQDFEGKIALAEGNNSLDFSGIRLLGGDLPGQIIGGGVPVSAAQDGVVNSYDIALIDYMINLPVELRRRSDNLALADLNLDGEVNAVDRSLILSALEIKTDEY